MLNYTNPVDSRFNEKKTSLKVLALPPATHKKLADAGIQTLDDLDALSITELLSIKGIGGSAFYKIKSAVEAYYYSIGVKKSFPVQSTSISEETRIEKMHAPIEEIGFTDTVCAGLKQSGIDIVGQIVCLTASEIKSIPSVGTERYYEIVSKTRLYLVENDVSLKFPVE